MLLNDQVFFFLRFFSADAGTSTEDDSSLGLLIDSSAVVSKSPLASETGTGAAASAFSSSGFVGSLTSSTGGASVSAIS